MDLAAGEGRNAIWPSRARLAYVTAVDFSRVALAKGRELAGDAAIEWVCADATTWRPDTAYDLAVIAYLQLAADERRAAVRRAFHSPARAAPSSWSPTTRPTCCWAAVGPRTRAC